MEVFSESGCSFLEFDSQKVSKQPTILMPVSTCQASHLSDNLLSSSLNLPPCAPNEYNSPHASISGAIFTVQLPSFQILVVNSAACQLIKFSSDELCSMKLTNLIIDSHKQKLSSLYEKFLKSAGEISESSEKLLELVRKDGEIILVSIYLKKLDSLERCLVIIKSIDRKAGEISVDKSGRILSFDENIGLIFQYDASEIVGLNIWNLLPAVNISKQDEDECKVLKQQITGKTKYGDAFPVSITLTHANLNSEEYKIVIWVFTSLNGVILLNSELLITTSNSYFIKLLFGYSKKDILNMSILSLIPAFCRDIGFKQSKKGQCQHISDTNSSYWPKEKELHCDCSGNPIINECLNCLKSNPNCSFGRVGDSSDESEWSATNFEINIDEHHELKPLYKCLSANLKSENKNNYEYSPVFRKKINFEEKYDFNNQINNEVGKINTDKKDKIFDSCCKNHQNVLVQEGKFLGFAQHSDGNYISIEYQVKISAINDEIFYRVWLSRDFLKFLNLNKRFYPKETSSVDGSFLKNSVYNDQCSRPSTASIISQGEENLIAGDYSQYYTNIRQIGKGAFGFVKMAFRNSDGLLVVTKFTKKQNTNLVPWVFHSNLNMKIPLEISLLTTLHHPNIVKVLDVFHNDSYVQLVMEKHGAGFDLFEFINRGPKCDEKLKSYIFRQIISAVHYLNSLGILHRDIKDENVIINEKFEIKLIDFGSATFMPRNETFSKFYGTIEYCSPEVLQGNSYKGPELEIWALGVTLYVLTFGENPFYNVEETIRGQFSVPFPISDELNNLLHHMLNKNVDARITIDKVVQHPWINQSVSIENYRFEEVVRCSKEEAYPPKFIHEINSDKFYVNNSRTESNNLEDASISISSLHSLREVDIFDDNFQEISKCSLSESARRKTNLSLVMFSPTPVQLKNNRLCKSATAVPSYFDNSLSFSDHRNDCGERSLEKDEFFSIYNYLRDLKSDLSSDKESNNFEEDVTIFNNIYESELEMSLKGCLLEDESLEKNNSTQYEVLEEIREIFNKSGRGEH